MYRHPSTTRNLLQCFCSPWLSHHSSCLAVPMFCFKVLFLSQSRTNIVTSASAFNFSFPAHIKDECVHGALNVQVFGHFLIFLQSPSTYNHSEMLLNSSLLWDYMAKTFRVKRILEKLNTSTWNMRTSKLRLFILKSIPWTNFQAKQSRHFSFASGWKS